MATLLDVIKLAGSQAVNAENPVNVLFGIVTAINPLSVQIDQKLILPEEVLIIPEHMTRYEVDLSHSHTHPQGSTGSSLGVIVIREGIVLGDRLILLRVQGGYQYLVIGKEINI